MPLDLHRLISNTAEASVDYGDAGTVNVVYRPGNITEKSLRELAVLNDSDNNDALTNIHAMNTVLLQTLVSWDLTNNGEPVPLTVDGLADVPLHVRGDIIKAIFEDIRLDPTTGTPSKPALPGSSAPNRAATSKKRA